MERPRSSFRAVVFNQQLAGTVRPRPRALHRARRLRHFLTANPTPDLARHRDVPRPHIA